MRISTTVGLSVNPTNRYIQEMGKLLRDHQLHVVASPTSAEQEVVDTSQFGDIDWPEYQSSSSFHVLDDEQQAFNSFREPDSTQTVGKKFDTPRPPPIPYYQRQRELFEGYYPPPTEEESHDQTQSSKFTEQLNANYQQPIEPHHHQPQRDTGELFEALNEHIENLDQQIQTSNSLRSVVDENFPQPEVEWGYDVSDGYFQVEEGYSSTEFDAVEANGSTYYFEATDQSQSDTQTPEQQPSEQENQSLRQELERLAFEKRAAEESAKRAAEELREKELLERERLEQLYIAEAKAARAERLEQEKEELQRELARQMAAENRRISESMRREPTSIVKSRLLPKLPDTNDPFELLGLDYENPPENAEDIRRAFLKMAKKYHPDAVAKDATEEEREKASLCFARINSAYQLLKDKQERLGHEYFATMLGGPMYEPRNSHGRQSFSRGYGFDNYGSIFSGNNYSATYGTKRNGGKRGSHSWNSRNPFRRNRQEVGDNCHVSMQDEDFPPFHNN